MRLCCFPRGSLLISSASDIWSLGCLFFELLTGEFLFYDDDWVKFFLRVTQGADVLTAEKKALIDDNVDLIKFFNFVLQRKQQYRPSLPDVVQRFLHLRATLTQKTPRYVPIPPKVVTQPVIKVCALLVIDMALSRALLS